MRPHAPDCLLCPIGELKSQDVVEPLTHHEVENIEVLAADGFICLKGRLGICLLQEEIVTVLSLQEDKRVLESVIGSVSLGNPCSWPDLSYRTMSLVEYCPFTMMTPTSLTTGVL